jgi:hypothetical protein
MQRQASVGEQLISVIRSYSEEWGSQNVLIAVPLEWERFGKSLTADEQMRLAFTTNGKIEVSAFDGGARRLHWEVDSEVVVKEAMASRAPVVQR